MTNADAEAAVPPRRLKVLFAEDEVLLRLMLCDVLRESGFQVFEAADAAEAIAILRTTPVAGVGSGDHDGRTCAHR